MAEKICNTLVTEKYLGKCLEESLGPNATLRSISWEQIAADQGFMSAIVRVHLTWENPDPSLPDSVVVKIPLVDSIQAKIDQLQDGGQEKSWNNVDEYVNAFHRCEANVYSLFRDHAPVPVPKCYVAALGSDDGPAMIVLEDLCSKASIIPSVITGISLPQLLNVTTELAKLHGWSLTTSIDWRSRIRDMDDSRPILEPMIGTMREQYQAIKRDYPDHFGSIDSDRMRTFLTFDTMLEYSSDHRSVMPDVLVHGDCWANNIMFEKMPDGTVGDRVMGLLDWQLSCRGSPMADLARIMSWSVPPEIRRTRTRQLVNHYYQTLKSIAGEKVAATVDQMQHWYDRNFAFMVLWILTGLNVFAEMFAKGEGEEKAKQKLEFVERMKANYEDAMVIVNNSDN